LVEKLGGLLQAVGFNAPGRQFNRECHAVKPSADVCYNRRVHVTDIQTGAACYRALHEELGCRKLQNSRRGESWGVGWTLKRLKSVNVLPLDPESLAARGQDVDLRRGLHDACGQRGSRFHQMFAGVEDHQYSLGF